jgi:hypothetical protein
LDVDHVQFSNPGNESRVISTNLARLTRSMRKSREQFGLEMPESSIAQLERAARLAGGSA